MVSSPIPSATTGLLSRKTQHESRDLSLFVFHSRVISILVSLLYIGLTVNFVLVYHLYQKCHSNPQSIFPTSSQEGKVVTEIYSRVDILDQINSTRTLLSSSTHPPSPDTSFTSSGITSSHHHTRGHRHRRHHDHHYSSRRVSRESDSVPSVEFFPKPQPTQETNGHVWLTSYSRIPLPALQEYCYSSKDYCPAGIPGPPGEKGLNRHT